ncbi:MAG TPA: MBL fold metallo-hydrolase [Acidimicrobiia bacterium]|nr:MBL fold metallo-hydrolase [Acidimicrobiia bacterium]
MHFVQYYLDCLSQASYLVGDEGSGRAVVVDPRRDVDVYLDDATVHGLRIERVIETHIHADFLSGHLELADKTGAVISYGDGAQVDFPIEPLRDGQTLPLGDVTLEAWATPGHTPESVSIVVREHPDDAVPYGVLTGDTMFIGDVGRPDLLSASGISPDDLARQLYRSLHEKLLLLPDATRVFPAHGAGSACGKNLSTETQSTIGEQRRTNYALQPMPEDAFVALVTEGQPLQPVYFSYDARRNRQSHVLMDEEEPPPSFTLEELVARRDAGAAVLDTRDPLDFAAGHLRGSINVGLHGRFAELGGDVLAPDRSVVLVSEPGTELEAKVRLGRVGFDRIDGALADPLRVLVEHEELVEPSSRLTVAELDARAREVGALQVVDVRNPGETADGTIPGAATIPLPQLTARRGELDPARPTVVYCASGYRSSIAASALAAAGFDDVSDVLGGFDAWKAQHSDGREKEPTG